MHYFEPTEVRGFLWDVESTHLLTRPVKSIYNAVKKVENGAFMNKY